MNSIEDTLARHVDEDSAIGSCSFEWMELGTLSSEIAALEAHVADAIAYHDHRRVERHKQEIAALKQRRARLLAHITTSLVRSDASSPHSEMAEGANPRQHHALPDEDRENVAAPNQQSAEVFELIPASRVAAPYANTTEGVTAVWDQLTPTDSKRTETTDLVGSAGSSPNPETTEGGDPSQPHGISEEDREDTAGPDQQSAEVFELNTASRVATPYDNTTEGVTTVWHQLTPTDIERATHEIDTRRIEMLARHQEEIKALNAEQCEVDTLADAIEAFARKFNFLKSPASVAAASSVG
jgi:hypothetical protein